MVSPQTILLVSGTTIFGSQSIGLSSIITSVQVDDNDEDIILNIGLSSDFIQSSDDEVGGLFDKVAGTFLNQPLVINASADASNSASENLLSRLNDIEIRTTSSQDDFNISATISTKDGEDETSDEISKDIFIGATPLSAPLFVNSTGELIDNNLIITEGGTAQFDIAVLLNGILNPNNVIIQFSGLPDGFQVVPVGGSALTESEGYV